MSPASGIDTASFPHIIDNVLNILCDNDPLTAASLQTVSRAWYTKIRTRLFSHIWLDHHPPEYLSVGTLPLRSEPSIRFATDLPLPWEYAPPVVVAAGRTARILDIRRMILRGYMLINEAWAPNLEMIRFGPECNDGTAPLPPADTVVIFKHPELVLTAMFNLLLADTPAKKVVIHLDDEDLALNDINSHALPDALENITVFYPFPPPDRAAREKLYDVYMEDIIEIIEDHFTNNDRILTFVSPDTLSPRYHYLSNPFEVSWAYLKSRLQSAPHLLANLEFLTATEYRERVGEETYHLHASMDRY